MCNNTSTAHYFWRWQPDQNFVVIKPSFVAETRHLQALIDGCLKGDRKSQQALHKMFYGKMKAICMRYTRDNDQAMDVTQEGFVKVFANLDKYTGVGSFEGWMRRIMVNLSIDRFRKLKHDFVLLGENQRLEDWEEQEEDDDDNEMNIIYDIRPEQIVEAMQRLSPAYRTVFNLYVYENYTHQDIAEALGISVGTSKSNYAKARRNMKKLLLKDLNKRNEQSFKAV